MQFIDTHCHIHEAQYELIGDDGVRAQWLRAGKPDPDDMIATAHDAGVTWFICVGTTPADSELAVKFAETRDNCYAAVGIHPHEAAKYINDQTALDKIAELTKHPKVVAIGECGLDYYYDHSPKLDQEKLFKFHLNLAHATELPLIFHVREAFKHFARMVYDSDAPNSLSGVVHSFTGTPNDLHYLTEMLDNIHDIYYGLNGIMTFTKDEQQLAAAKAIPLNRLVLETDAPFLTPAPYRGTICEPKHVRVTAEFLAKLRGEELAELAAATTSNATTLFKLKE